MAELRTHLEETTSDYDREKIAGTARELAGGVAIIKVVPQPRPR